MYCVYEVGKFTDAKKLLRQMFGDKRQQVREEQKKTTYLMTTLIERLLTSHSIYGDQIKDELDGSRDINRPL